MKLGVIGYGLMAGAITDGIAGKRLLAKEDIIISVKSEASRKRAEANGFRAVRDNCCAACCDMVLIAVPPRAVPDVLDEIRETVRKNGTIVWSVAAEVSVAEMEGHLGDDAKVVRTLPNTCAAVGASVTAVAPNANVSDEELKSILDLIGGFGIAEIMDEGMIDATIPVTGSSPAMVFMLIDAMTNGAARAGFSWEQSLRFSAQAVKGAAEMVLSSGRHPAELQNQVCTPGGITLEMIKRLEESGFRNAVMEGMQACMEAIE